MGRGSGEVIDYVDGEQLKQLRQARGWNQRELGKRATLSYASICGLETKPGYRINIDSFGRLAEALGVDAAEILKIEDPFSRAMKSATLALRRIDLRERRTHVLIEELQEVQRIASILTEGLASRLSR